MFGLHLHISVLLKEVRTGPQAETEKEVMGLEELLTPLVPIANSVCFHTESRITLSEGAI